MKRGSVEFFSGEKERDEVIITLYSDENTPVRIISTELNKSDAVKLMRVLVHRLFDEVALSVYALKIPNGVASEIIDGFASPESQPQPDGTDDGSGPRS